MKKPVETKMTEELMFVVSLKGGGKLELPSRLVPSGAKYPLTLEWQGRRYLLESASAATLVKEDS